VGDHDTRPPVGDRRGDMLAGLDAGGRVVGGQVTGHLGEAERDE
jgi:phosphoglycolate phosphatase-like HAD superfamily hydrolase